MSQKHAFGKFLGTFPEKTRKISVNLRVMILKIIPRASETVHSGMNWVVYGVPRSIIAIKPEEKSVKLFFFEGVKLNDPYNLLKGSGTRLRFINVPEINQNKEKIMELIKQAYFLTVKKNLKV
jgi:hypothetical protein